MKIQVLLCVHNGQRFVREAILSMLGQTYHDFELLVVDDASTDETAELLKELAASDPRVRVITNETNLGLTKSLNIALAAVCHPEKTPSLCHPESTLPHSHPEGAKQLKDPEETRDPSSAVRPPQDDKKERPLQDEQAHGALRQAQGIQTQDALQQAQGIQTLDALQQAQGIQPLDDLQQAQGIQTRDALQQSQGIFVARMDADDIAFPERLAKQLTFLENHPAIDMVGTAFEWIDADGKVIGKPAVITDSDQLHRALIRTNPFLHGSIMIRRTVLEQAGGYDERYKKAQDYDLWLRLSRTTRFANLPEVLMQKRMTRNMISFKSERAQIRFAIRARLAALKRGDYPLWCAVYLLKPFLATVLPLSVVRWARARLFGQKVYAHRTLKEGGIPRLPHR